MSPVSFKKPISQTPINVPDQANQNNKYQLLIGPSVL